MTPYKAPVQVVLLQRSAGFDHLDAHALLTITVYGTWLWTDANYPYHIYQPSQIWFDHVYRIFGFKKERQSF